MFGKKSTPGGSTPDYTRQSGEQTNESDQLPAVIHFEHSHGGQVVSAQHARELAEHIQQVTSDYSRKREDILTYTDPNLETPAYREAKIALIEKMITSIDFASLQKLPRDKRKERVNEAATRSMSEIAAPLTAAQIELLKQQALDEILGLGPIEPLLSDPEVSDIMINTSQRIYVEKSGRIFLTDITFLNEKHLRGIIQRIVSRVGRRIDESSPMCDARLEDGSRFNAIIPPLALDGSLVSIRKFKKNKMPLSDYVEYDSMSPNMCRFLEICASIRLNIIVSGGTGSGKTTLLNALSGHIEPSERVITIEDAAEIQMHQPHVLRLETRPPSTEGTGEITQRQLVKNALRMRPDRIILGEIRGDEVIDVLSAMNTGHDGSMATIHANTPRDCLARIENLVGMSGVNVTPSSLRYQIASALHLVVQLQRMRDGRRRITKIEEIVGQEGDIIVSQTLFEYKTQGMGQDGKLKGEFVANPFRPKFMPQAEYFNKEQEIRKCLGI